MRNTGDNDIFAQHWSQFLIHHNRVFNAFEATVATSSNGQLRAWWGRIVGIRKRDELLAYLHQARNADDHGLSRVSVVQPPINAFGMFIGSKPRAGHIVTNKGTRLVPVVNRGVTYKLPTRHLGKPLRGMTRPALLAAAAGLAPPPKPISDMADLGVKFCEGLLIQAAAYISFKPSP